MKASSSKKTMYGDQITSIVELGIRCGKFSIGPFFSEGIKFAIHGGNDPQYYGVCAEFKEFEVRVHAFQQAIELNVHALEQVVLHGNPVFRVTDVTAKATLDRILQKIRDTLEAYVRRPTPEARATRLLLDLAKQV